MEGTSPSSLWLFLPVGFLLTVLVETPILVIGLSARHTIRRRLFAGLWLNACSYPVVILVLPLVLASASCGANLWVAETFAPVAECALFWAAFGERRELNRPSMWRDFAAIVIANLASFGLGEALDAYGWFGAAG